MVDFTKKTVGAAMRMVSFDDMGTKALGALLDDGRFVNITRTLPEFPTSLSDILALKNAFALLNDALHFAHGEPKPTVDKLLAPVCEGSNMWGLSCKDGCDGVYLHAKNNIVGSGQPMVAPFREDLYCWPGINFVIGKPMHNVAVANVMDYVEAFTLFNVGIVGSPKILRGTASQFRRFSSLGPYLQAFDNKTFFKNKNIVITKNKAIVYQGPCVDAVKTCTYVLSALTHTVDLNPGDSLAISIGTAFEVAVGDTISVNIEGFGVLENTIIQNI